MLLKTEIENIEQALYHFNKKNTFVSKSGVDWHLDHVLKVINGISDVLIKSNPEDYKWSFSFIKKLVFLRGKFPRGKAKAPKEVVATSTIKKDEIVKQIEYAKQQLKIVEGLPKKSHFKHPIFGTLNLRDTQKFLKIHTNHHLKIVDEIISL